MNKSVNYDSPEFKVMKYKGEDVITASEIIVNPPWGGEEVTNPEILIYSCNYRCLMGVLNNLLPHFAIY